MIVFSGLNVEAKEDELSEEQFCHAVPVVSNRRTVVHFLKIDVNDRNRFGLVLKVLSEDSLPQPFNINRVLERFQKGHRPEAKYSECRCKGKEEGRQ
jgi:hypothetical protein